MVCMAGEDVKGRNLYKMCLSVCGSEDVGLYSSEEINIICTKGTNIQTIRTQLQGFA